MQEPGGSGLSKLQSSPPSSSSTNQQFGGENPTTNPQPQSSAENFPDDSVLQCNLAGRRNALTPESHNIDPIRQTEIQEKMSNLTMASGSGTCGGGEGASGSGSDIKDCG